MTHKALGQLRRLAFECPNASTGAAFTAAYLCGRATARPSRSAFSKRLGISRRVRQTLRCTAEHLIARQDGGRNTQDNVLAACTECNHGRHDGRSDNAPSPGEYLKEVQKDIRGRRHWGLCGIAAGSALLWAGENLTRSILGSPCSQPYVHASTPMNWTIGLLSHAASSGTTGNGAYFRLSSCTSMLPTSLRMTFRSPPAVCILRWSMAM